MSMLMMKQNMTTGIFILLLLPSFIGAACYIRSVPHRRGCTGCCFGGNIMIRGENQQIGCENCRCVLPGKLQCCSIGMVITSHPDDCKIIRQGCTEVAVKKYDESVYCTDGLSGIGR